MRREFPAFLCTFFLLCGGAQAAEYFVASGGDDAAGGLSEGEAWRTLNRVNAQDLEPGDRVLLEGGTVFPGTLELFAEDAGRADAPVEVTSFGSGRAVIDGGLGDGVSIWNAGGIELRGLDVIGLGPEDNGGYGVTVYADSAGGERYAHIRLVDLTVRGFRLGGISVGSGNGSYPGFDNVVIGACRVHGNGEAGITSWGHYDPESGRWAHRDLLVTGNEVFENLGDPFDLFTHTGNGIVLSSVDGALIERNRAWGNGGLNSENSGGPVGIWAWDARDVTVEYNISHHNRTGGGADGGGFDFDGGVIDSLMQYNLSYQNHGAGYLVAQFPGAPPMFGNTMRHNWSINDGRNGGYGGITLWAGDGVEAVDQLLHDNTIVMTEPAAQAVAAVVSFGGDFRDITLLNNILLTAGTIDQVLAFVSFGPEEVRMVNNLYWRDDGGFRVLNGFGTFESIEAWRDAGQERWDGIDRGVHGDPMLVSGPAGTELLDPEALEEAVILMPLPGSAAVDMGLDPEATFGMPGASADARGVAIPQGTAIDIGATEAPRCTGADHDDDGLCDAEDRCEGFDPSGDLDGDGHCALASTGLLHDCNDDEPSVYPGAPEACIEEDSNCDGVPDDCTGCDCAGSLARERPGRGALSIWALVLGGVLVRRRLIVSAAERVERHTSGEA